MDFGGVEYVTAHSGTLSLGTDSNLTAATTGISIFGSPNAASISITGPASEVIEVKCETKAHLKSTGGGGPKIDLTLIEAVIDTGVTFGSGVTCDGIKNKDNVVATVDLGVNPTPTLLLGARITLPNNQLTPNIWSTTAGKDFTVRVVFQ